jgi:hypothetical protein
MSDQQQQEQQPPMPYSVKVEQTARGARVSVHVYAKSPEEVTQQVVELYTNIQKQLTEAGHVIAPVEAK